MWNKILTCCWYTLPRENIAFFFQIATYVLLFFKVPHYNCCTVKIKNIFSFNKNCIPNYLSHSEYFALVCEINVIT